MESIALFGEAEKGLYNTAYFCKSLSELVDCLGHPPEQTYGLYFAIQSLHYGIPILFFRVREEGFSFENYQEGSRLLAEQNFIHQIPAIGLPGVGDQQILYLIEPIRNRYHSILLTTEADLFDYLTA